VPWVSLVRLDRQTPKIILPEHLRQFGDVGRNARRELGLIIISIVPLCVSATEFNGEGRAMKSPVVKRSIVLSGHKRSVSLEEALWRGLKDIATTRRMTLSDLVGASIPSASTAISRRRYGCLCWITTRRATVSLNALRYSLDSR